MKCIFDIECDGLLDSITKIHCLSYLNLESPQEVVSLTTYESIKSFVLQEDLTLIAHNGVMYDIPALNKILKIEVKAKMIDTLAISWYLDPKRKKHGLEEWGEELGIKKPKIANWSSLSLEEYVHRCEEDVKINYLLWKKQKNTLNKIYFEEEKSLNRLLNYLMFKMEIVRDQEKLGVAINVPHIQEMIGKLQKEVDQKRKDLVVAMPKVAVYTKKVVKDAIQVGEDIYTKGDMFYEMMKGTQKPREITIKKLKGYKEANAGSSLQIKNWLTTLGWVPQNIKHQRNKDTNEVKQIPQVLSKEAQRDGSGEICQSIKKLYRKEPKLELLEGLSVTSSRKSVFENFLKNNKEGRLYPSIKGFTNTLRVKHKIIVNLPGLDKLYGEEVRASIIADEGMILCGSDLSGIEDNTKRHYIHKYDPKYVEEMNTPGFDAHLDIGLLAGMFTQEEVDFYKDYEVKIKDHTFVPAAEDKERYKKLKGIRNKAKIVNFSATYKIMAPALSRNSGMKLSEAKKLLDIYWKRNKAITQIEKDLKIKTVEGKMWQKNPVNGFWYSLRTDKDKFSTLNQGTAAYIFDLWLTYLKQEGIIVPFQYHDEHAFNLNPKDKSIIVEKILKSIDKVNSKVKLKTTIKCSIQFGNNYSEIH